MLGGAPPDTEIILCRARLREQMDALKWEADQDHSPPWKSFQAGAMCVVSRRLDKELARFGVEVSDG